MEINCKENKSYLKLHFARTEAGRKFFAVQPSMIYNDLIKDIREVKSHLRLTVKVGSLKF